MRVVGERAVTADQPLLAAAADPVETAVQAEELATTLESEIVLGPPDVDVSLVEEITHAESLVARLDSEVRGTARGLRSGGPEDKTDDVLVVEVRAGDNAALTELLQRYRMFARSKARSYFLVGADREDVVQEGMIGLFKAIRDFDVDRESSFRSFAELCITRQILTAIKTATRQKHSPLNNYVSFSRPVTSDEAGEQMLSDVLPTRAISDPADLVISAERIRALQAHVDEVLSELETEVLRLYVEGKSYQEIAERLQRHVKSIDNALQRIKKKLEEHIKARNAAESG